MKFLPNKFIVSILLFSTVIALNSCSKDSNDPTPTETTVTTADFSKTMDENPSNGQVIGTVQGSTNEGTVTFSITEQTPSGAFSIDATSGELKVADETLFDFETNPTITGTVKVANGAVSENASVTITLNNVSEENIYEGDVILKTQEEVNLFGTNRYTTITGSLTIGDPEEGATTDIFDLSPLQSIKTTTSSLIIINNPDLVSTTGLNVHHIGGQLALINNRALITLEGFDSITSLPLGLFISYNTALADFSSLSQITSVKNLSLSGCSALTNIEWLSNLTSIDNGISIYSCNSLTNIDGLRNLTILTSGDIEIRNNQSLKNLNGLQNLSATLRILTIYENSSLLSISGLENINFNNAINISNNDLLENLSGLETVTSLLNDLSIENNNSLIDLQGLNNMSQSGAVNINNNESLVSLNGLNNLSDVYMIDVISNSQLSDFCALQNLFSVDPGTYFSSENNAYNPTKQDIIDGNCSL